MSSSNENELERLLRWHLIIAEFFVDLAKRDPRRACATPEEFLLVADAMKNTASSGNLRSLKRFGDWHEMAKNSFITGEEHAALDKRLRRETGLSWIASEKKRAKEAKRILQQGVAAGDDLRRLQERLDELTNKPSTTKIERAEIDKILAVMATVDRALPDD
ncbi:MAG: hypothetical protein R3D27_02350 [Hyphomicrobiaceae bacterium]